VVLSPILVRPVREQLEHDRVIRLLQVKYKKKFEVAINPGNEQTAPVGAADSPWYPDLVLQTTDKNHKLAGVVEVESAESVNHLEAMSQWKAFAGLRVPFHLYLPSASVDSARRFCTEMEIPVAEMWAYQAVGDQIRFALVHRIPQPDDAKPATPEPRPRAVAPRPVAARPAAPARPASPRPAPARAAAASRPSAAAPSRPAAGGRARPNGQARQPVARRASTATPSRAAAAKPKASAARRAAPKPVQRKAKSASSSSRAQKRR